MLQLTIVILQLIYNKINKLFKILEKLLNI